MRVIQENHLIYKVTWNKSLYRDKVSPNSFFHKNNETRVNGTVHQLAWVALVREKSNNGKPIKCILKKEMRLKDTKIVCIILKNGGLRICNQALSKGSF